MLAGYLVLPANASRSILSCEHWGRSRGGECDSRDNLRERRYDHGIVEILHQIKISDKGVSMPKQEKKNGREIQK